MASFSHNEELSKVCCKLWELDDNRLFPDVHYELDLQKGTEKHSHNDKSKRPLFKWVDASVFEKPTFKSFKVLLDNYESSLGRPERETLQEHRENWTFIDNICETKVMKQAHLFLVSKKKCSADISEFKQLLYNLWFKMYKRTSHSGTNDSSGFEHVFVGETRDKRNLVEGFHNWIQFYQQEKLKKVDYHGYITGKRPNKDDHLLTIQFTWKGEVKPIGSTFIGTSPEFEIALYTICFLCRTSHPVSLKIADFEVKMVVHDKENKIATCYPIAL